MAELTSKLEDLGCVGWIIDGARVDYPGWVLARLVLTDEQDASALRAQLAVTWPEVRIDEVEVSSVPTIAPSRVPSSAPLHEVAVARTKGLGLDFEAEFEKVCLAEARVAEKSVFARVQPVAAGEQLLEVFTSAKGGSVVLWRRGRRLVLALLRRSKVVGFHVWEPQWSPLGGDRSGEIRTAMLGPTVDAAQVVDVLEPAPQLADSLCALMHRESPPFDELCALLELPTEAMSVISGECSVEGLPGAVIHTPEGMRSPDGELVELSDDDPKWISLLEEGARELKWWYLAWNVVIFVVFVGLIMRWVDGGSGFWGLLGASGVVLTAKNLFDLWAARRRAL
ncbi:hypothetical protein [Aeromicrobium sp. UC242_57]|uniref:hypothetical protein n=1 Tax=Aeromicrobium sp. UC242_57 TaxID=3374624 RepID=UPI00379ACA56